MLHGCVTGLKHVLLQAGCHAHSVEVPATSCYAVLNLLLSLYLCMFGIFSSIALSVPFCSLAWHLVALGISCALCFSYPALSDFPHYLPAVRGSSRCAYRTYPHLHLSCSCACFPFLCWAKGVNLWRLLGTRAKLLPPPLKQHWSLHSCLPLHAEDSPPGLQTCFSAAAILSFTGFACFPFLLLCALPKLFTFWTACCLASTPLKQALDIRDGHGSSSCSCARSRKARWAAALRARTWRKGAAAISYFWAFGQRATLTSDERRRHCPATLPAFILDALVTGGGAAGSAGARRHEERWLLFRLYAAGSYSGFPLAFPVGDSFVTARAGLRHICTRCAGIAACSAYH